MEVSHSNAEKEPTEDNDTNTGYGETVGCRVGVLLLFIFAVSLVWNASSWLIDRYNDPKAIRSRHGTFGIRILFCCNPGI